MFGAWFRPDENPLFGTRYIVIQVSWGKSLRRFRGVGIQCEISLPIPVLTAEV